MVDGSCFSPSWERPVAITRECLVGDKDMSLDEVRSEGLWQWNMDMDVEYQYETFNGLPVYYGRDMYDSEDSEEYDPLEMARAACVADCEFDTRRCPDGGEARIVGEVDMVPTCQNVSWVTRSEPDVPSDTAGTEPSAVMEGSDIEDFFLWTDLLNEEESM